MSSNNDHYVNLDADVVLTGVSDTGRRTPLAATGEGHLEVAIHSPAGPFHSLHVEAWEPQFQADGVYGINTGLVTASLSGSGTATTSDSAFVCTTGTTIYSFGTIQSRRRLRYRPGQGVIIRFTAAFTQGVALSIQVAGAGHAEDGLYVGYNNTLFGLLHSSRGRREIRTLTVTVASTTTENITITLNTTVVVLVAVTNSGSTLRTAYEISKGTYPGWKAESLGSTVIFIKDAVGAASGTYGLSLATTAAGTFAQTRAGAAASESWVYQTAWNIDKLDGNGNSAFLLDPTKLNVYQLKIQYLGAGACVLEVETVDSLDGNNNTWTVCHELKFPNTRTQTIFGNPAFPFTMAAYSAGSTTDLTVKSGSFSGFIEGQHVYQGNRFTYSNTITTVGATNYQVLFTVLNSRVYKSVANQSVSYILSISAAIKHTSPVLVYMIKNATLAGNVNFAAWASNSCTSVDTAATTCTFTDNEQIIWTGIMGDTGDITFTFEDDIELQPGESITICAKASTGTPAFVSAAINTREDQ